MRESIKVLGRKEMASGGGNAGQDITRGLGGDERRNQKLKEREVSAYIPPCSKTKITARGKVRNPPKFA